MQAHPARSRNRVTQSRGGPLGASELAVGGEVRGVLEPPRRRASADTDTIAAAAIAEAAFALGPFAVI